MLLLMLLRYNNYDRAVINTVPHNMVQRWYVAHRQLTDELRKPENELWVKLKPGKVTKPGEKNDLLFTLLWGESVQFFF